MSPRPACLPERGDGADGGLTLTDQGPRLLIKLLVVWGLSVEFGVLGLRFGV